MFIVYSLWPLWVSNFYSLSWGIQCLWMFILISFFNNDIEVSVCTIGVVIYYFSWFFWVPKTSISYGLWFWKRESIGHTPNMCALFRSDCWISAIDSSLATRNFNDISKWFDGVSRWYLLWEALLDLCGRHLGVFIH